MTDQQFNGHTTYGTLGGIITILLVNINAGDLIRTVVLAGSWSRCQFISLACMQLLAEEVAKIKSSF
jgi:hypothetical protein